MCLGLIRRQLFLGVNLLINTVLSCNFLHRVVIVPREALETTTSAGWMPRMENGTHFVENGSLHTRELISARTTPGRLIWRRRLTRAVYNRGIRGPSIEWLESKSRGTDLIDLFSIEQCIVLSHRFFFSSFFRFTFLLNVSTRVCFCR